MNYNKDIKDWTLEFAILIIKLSEELKAKRIDIDVVSQIRRSGTSVGANVREAKASSSRKELARFYDIALRSANETSFWIEVLKKGYEFDSELLGKVTSELNQIEKIIAKIIVNLKKPAVQPA
ncbi:MAG TPA: four helix bundle protein [Bacteroidia bacterium]